MLYETLNQTYIFLSMLYFGIICGIFFEAKTLIEKTFKNQKIICLIFDISFMVVSSLIFILGKNIVNFGEFRIYLLFGFILGIILEHTTIGYLVEKLFILFYTLIIKALNWFKTLKPKSKLMQKILK